MQPASASAGPNRWRSGRAFIAWPVLCAILLVACAGCIVDDFSPTPAPQRVEHASGTLAVSADQPMASVWITAEVTPTDAGRDVERVAFFDVNTVLRPCEAGSVEAGSVPGCADDARRVLIGFRSAAVPGRGGDLLWSQASGDTPDRRQDRAGLPVCSRGCSASVELVVLLADPSAGPATIDWTADLPVTYRSDPPPPDTVGIRADDPALVPSSAMSSLTDVADPIELDEEHPIAKRRVQFDVPNTAGLVVQELGTAIAARVASSGGAHRSVIVKVASRDPSNDWLQVDAVGHEISGAVRPRWTCAGDTCVGTLDLEFRRVQDASDGATTVEWSLLGWAITDGVTWHVRVEPAR